MLELMITMTIFSVLAYALLSALGLSTSSREAVNSMASANTALRDAVRAIADDLRVSSEDRTVIVAQPDGSSQITLQLPIMVGAAVTWGVPAEDSALVGGADEAGWSVRYSVVEGADGVQRLMRRILDAAGNQVRSSTIAEGLSDGDGGAPPGMTLQMTGDVWEITVALAGRNPRTETMNVSSRN